MKRMIASTIATAFLSVSMPIEVFSAEDSIAKPEAETTKEDTDVEVELARDPEEALRILEETGRWLEQIPEMEAGGGRTEESNALRNKINTAMRQIDLENLELPDGVLLSDEDLVRLAIMAVRSNRPNGGPDLLNPPPVMGYRNGWRVVTFPNELPEGFRGPDFRIRIIMHPITGQVLAKVLG